MNSKLLSIYDLLEDNYIDNIVKDLTKNKVKLMPSRCSGKAILTYNIFNKYLNLNNDIKE